MTKPVVLCSTLHDPTGSLRDLIPETAELVSQHYKAWVVNATPGTYDNAELMEALKESGVKVVRVEDDEGLPFNLVVEGHHRNALREGVNTAGELGVPNVQYFDADRVVRAALDPEYFEHMAEVAARIEENSFVSIARPEGDFLAHPPSLVLTEGRLMIPYQTMFGERLDPGSTNEVMTSEVARAILEVPASEENGGYPHLKWAIEAHKAGANVTAVEIPNVGAFETQLQVFRHQLPEGGAGMTNAEIHAAYLETESLKLALTPSEWRARQATIMAWSSLLNTNMEHFELDDAEWDYLSQELLEIGQDSGQEWARMHRLVEAGNNSLLENELPGVYREYRSRAGGKERD